MSRTLWLPAGSGLGKTRAGVEFAEQDPGTKVLSRQTQGEFLSAGSICGYGIKVCDECGSEQPLLIACSRCGMLLCADCRTGNPPWCYTCQDGDEDEILLSGKLIRKRCGHVMR